MIDFLTITVGMVIAALVPPQRETGFLNRTLTLGNQNFRYQVYVPAAFDETRRAPIILFLHGSGERGSDGIRQTAVGLGAAIRANPDRFPAIVVFPQAPEEKRWSGEGEEIALTALDEAMAEFHADPARVYLVGISMGGRGALQIASRMPERFAALIAVCGWVVPPKEFADDGENTTAESSGTPGVSPYAAAAERLRAVPLRLYHGSLDTIVPPSESRRLAVALHEDHADAKYVELSGVGHAAWEKAFADPDLWKWLLGQSRAAAPQ